MDCDAGFCNADQRTWHYDPHGNQHGYPPSYFVRGSVTYRHTDPNRQPYAVSVCDGWRDGERAATERPGG